MSSREVALEQPPLPGPMRVAMVVLLSGALGYALVVTPLALVNRFEKRPVLIAAGIVAAVVAAAWLRALSPLPRSKITPALLVALTGIVAITALNARNSSQNVVQDRDPGAYIDSARWFAGHHTFFFDGLVGAFSRHAELSVVGAGFQTGASGGRVYPQFLHLLPAFLAGVQWFGGTSMMFRANALFGFVALLAFFAFARTFVREGLASVAALMLAFNLVEVLLSRNAYSEILSQVFLFGGLWALTEADRIRKNALYLIAGLLLGVTCMVRIDGFVYLIPLTIAGTMRLWHVASSPPAEVQRVRTSVATLGVGVLVPSLLGLIDGLRFSRPYLVANKAFLLEILAGLVVTWVACVGALRRRRRRGRPLFTRRAVGLLGGFAAIAIVSVSAYAWFIRPHVETAYQMARSAGGIYDLRTHKLPAEIRIRTFSEVTLSRLALFLGATTLVGGILGSAFVTKRIVSDATDRRVPFLMIFGVTTTLYVWRPSIAADMIWFLRRFLPVTIPGLILLSMVLAEELIRRRRQVFGIAAAVLVAGGLAFPLYLLPHYVFRRTYVPLYSGLTKACAQAGRDAALLVVQSTNIISGPQYRYPQALQAFCGVPVATTAPGLPAAFYSNLAEEWHRRGRRLVVVADSPDALKPVQGEARLLQASTYNVLERSDRHRPTKFEKRLLFLFFKTVPVNVGT
jgi:hypothetical protein